jgi:hypothetical protein
LAEKALPNKYPDGLITVLLLKNYSACRNSSFKLWNKYKCPLLLAKALLCATCLAASSA